MENTLAVAGRALLYGGVTIAMGEVATQWVFGGAWRERAAVATRTRAQFAWLAVLSALLVLFVAQFVALELAPTATDVAMLVRQTTWGMGWLQLAACAVIGAILATARAPLMVRAMVVTLLAIAMGGMGHAAADESMPLLSRALDALHVLGVGAWIGMLFCVGSAVTHDAWARASAMATVAAPVTLLTGAGAAIRRVIAAPFSTIVASDYGRLLIIKLALVAFVMLLAIWNRNELRRTGVPSARRVRLELLLAIGVLCVTAVLTGTAPPGE
jgi:putative copper export protein